MDELSLLRLDPDEKLKLDEQDSIILNSTLTSPKTIIEIPTKSYVDGLHESSRNGRDLSSVFNDQDKEVDKNKLINLDSVLFNRNPNSDNELSSKNYVDDSIAEGTIGRFKQTLENYLRVSVGNDTYNLTEYDKIQITDVTEIRYPNIGYDLLPRWRVKTLYRTNGTKAGNVLKFTITSSPTSESGATNLPPIGSAFMYVELISNNHGHEKVFVRSERTDNFPVGNITFYYKRFSILTNESKRSLGCFRVQLLLEDNTWSTRYNFPKNDRYSN